MTADQEDVDALKDLVRSVACGIIDEKPPFPAGAAKAYLKNTNFQKVPMPSIPNNILQILRDRELTPSKRLVAYAMFVPGLPGNPIHEITCQANLELGKRIKKLINNRTIEITGMNENSALNISNFGSF